jgi:hypothetical protein
VSAAEKLKALETGIHSHGTPEWFAAHDMVVYALPQIIALVEAAEEVAARVPTIARPIPASLAALDQALGDVT